MAYSKASNELVAIRHDYGSLFGGGAERDFSDTQVFELDPNNGDVTFRNLEDTYRVVYRAVEYSADYTGAFDEGIFVRDEYVGYLSPINSSSDDYMLDWGRARFNSISIEFKSDDNTWYTGYKYSMTGSPSQAFPNRGTSDSEIIEDIRNSITSDPNATYGSIFYASWEAQCALFNWQWPEGSSVVQYLFGNDNLNGTRKDDVMTGGAGNDVVSGGVGNDVLYGSYGSDTVYGGAGRDVIVFDGGSSQWDYLAGTSSSRGAYVSRTLDQASGGSGADYFVYELPGVTFCPSDPIYPALPDLYGNATGTATYYNPFLSQSQNATPFSTAASSYGVSPLTFRTRILDFKVGEDKLDLSNFGIDLEFIGLKSLSKLSGNAFITAANLALKPDGYALSIGKSASTSTHTTLFIREAGVDTNDNGKLTDTLVEIQLVGLATSSIGIKLFGDAPSIDDTL